MLSFVRARRNPANPSRLFNLLALGPALLAALLSTIAFIVDLALVGLVKKRIKNATEGDLIVNWGNAVRFVPLTFVFINTGGLRYGWR